MRYDEFLTPDEIRDSEPNRGIPMSPTFVTRTPRPRPILDPSQLREGYRAPRKTHGGY